MDQPTMPIKIPKTLENRNPNEQNDSKTTEISEMSQLKPTYDELEAKLEKT